MAQSCAGGRPCAFGFPFGPSMFPQDLVRNIDGEILWQQLLQLVDDGMLEFGRYVSTADQGTPEAATTENDLPSTSEHCRNLLARMSEAAQRQRPAAKDGKEDMFLVQIPLGSDIKPENMKVSLKDRVLTVEVKQEEASEDGNSRHYQEFSKRISIPDEVKIEEIKSVLQPNGILRIEAPLPKPKVEEPAKPTEIPVDIQLE